MATEPALIPVIDAGLGNTTYLLELGGGRALVLDPERDLRQVRAEARQRGLTITHAVETHLHADFVSGVRAPDQSPEDIAWEAAKVGFDSLAGELEGGMEEWADRGATATVVLGRAEELVGQNRAAVLDIRQSPEFDAGHVPGAHHIELGALEENLARVPQGPLVVMCGHGERAMGAAGILLRAGRTGVRVLAGGPAEWSAASGGNPGAEE
ncbi:rhodanese-like domain-containing protein [Nocardiopsis sp. YSL2]|uniref:rhodanese-like domain-containing protein n=1 Tax=Nocardiopsis sp. YSL2 TaxID=2939492 RepID=UPI0026F46B0F|nr:rhodanese-like domain-containing protein [Nocardiopsis sp. YSL2]